MKVQNVVFEVTFGGINANIEPAALHGEVLRVLRKRFMKKAVGDCRPCEYPEQIEVKRIGDGNEPLKIRPFADDRVTKTVHRGYQQEVKQARKKHRRSR